MRERRVIKYRDELNDEFSDAVIAPRRIDGGYDYTPSSPFRKFTSFFWYRIVATPVAFAVTKLGFGHKIVGREKLKPFRKKGFFIYGNHTHDLGDAIMPAMIVFPKRAYVIVHAANVSIKGVGNATRSMGAIPLPDDTAAFRNFTACIKTRYGQGHAVVVYPEAHIWPYYTGIRNFRDVSFAYPVECGSPVFCFTNTYQKRRFFKGPRTVTYVDGPFFPDPSLGMRAARKALRDEVYKAMCLRAANSTEKVIEYVKDE